MKIFRYVLYGLSFAGLMAFFMKGPQAISTMWISILFLLIASILKDVKE